MDARNGNAESAMWGAVTRPINTLQHAVDALPDTDKKTLVLHTAQLMSDADQQDVARELTHPNGGTTNYLWLIVISAFAIVLVGTFLTLAISVFVGDGTSPELILTLFTSVVGFLAGLFTPSPVSTGKRH